ncbi:hypothetical protein [Candidatus Tisiphia endosymbiont of Sialis lutaria]|uniref:hypothetical protein n=1 Tax=Candidatus Tisiphia endosymbiont of Sialis lutaria TaxID=2029164 RepID=UPI00312C7D7D
MEPGGNLLVINQFLESLPGVDKIYKTNGDAICFDSALLKMGENDSIILKTETKEVIITGDFGDSQAFLPTRCFIDQNKVCLEFDYKGFECYYGKPNAATTTYLVLGESFNAEYWQSLGNNTIVPLGDIAHIVESY